jgi:hypothetical protein
LRHVDEDPQHVDLREAEKLARPGGGAGGDECAGIHVAGRDHAVERRVHLLEALQLEQAVDVRVVGVHRRTRGVDRLLRGGHAGRPLVDLLLRYRARAGGDVALERRPREPEIRLELHDVRLVLRHRRDRLHELLVDLGVSISARSCPLFTRSPMST